MGANDDQPPQDCDSCGDTAAVVLVRRVYLPIDLERQRDLERQPDVEQQADLDSEISTGELEWWCEVCRIHYPHQID